MDKSGSRLSALGPRLRVGEVVGEIEALVGQGEAREIVAAYFDQPRHWPSLNGDAPVTSRDHEAIRRAAARRAKGAPLQYAVGRASFRHLTLSVDERVLIPRPETELLVDLVLRRAPAGGVAVDVGTGSGAIAIALASEGAFDRVIATDLSTDALDVARANAARAGVAVTFAAGDLLGALARPKAAEGVKASDDTLLSAVVSNPPYITFDEAGSLPPDVRDWEPAVALFSPGSGLAVTRRLAAQAAPLLQDGGLFAVEVDARRASLVAELVARDARFASVTVELDLTGRERFVLAVRRRRSIDD